MANRNRKSGRNAACVSGEAAPWTLRDNIIEGDSMSNTVNIRRNLQVQFEKIYHHNRQGSYKTKARYRDAFKRFISFLADTYHLERLANIKPKHLYAYTEYLVDRGLSIAYIKTELAAIRFFHDQIPAAKNLLPDNDQLELGRRRLGGVDRTWSDAELQRAIDKAHALGRPEYAALLLLGRYAGLRIHECFRLDTAAAANTIKSGVVTIKGKGGLVRSVPAAPIVLEQLQLMLDRTARGQKLFVSGDDKTHLAIHRLENFIGYYRDELRDADSDRPMTFHGLRHSYAAEQYQLRIDAGHSPRDARLQVARLLGHGRDDVTRIYTVSVENKQPIL
ncbi:MAG: site-specific integrase [Angelakisella sp.]